jgi:hypothetical protein
MYGSPISDLVLRPRGTPTPTPAPAPAFDWTGYEAPFDLSIISTLFQNIAGTTVVSADGQDIACIRHPVSPNGILWVAPSLTDCFVYVADGGKPYMRPKTVNAFLSLAAASSSVMHMFVAMRQPSVIDNGRIVSPNFNVGTGDVNPYLSTKAARIIEFYQGGNVMNTTSAPAAGVDFLIEALTTGSGFSTPPWGALFVNGVSEGGAGSNTTPGAAAIANGVRLGPGGGFGGTTLTDLRFYAGLFSRTQIVGTPLLDLRAYLQSRY